MENEFGEIEKQNDKYLEIFGEDLCEAGLTDKTIKNHILNVGLYINDYILYHCGESMEEGCSKRIDEFFGYYSIRKCMWSTPATIKSTAASLKKFYKCMVEHHYVDKDVYQLFCQIIKENMTAWQEECSDFNNWVD